MKKKLMTAAQAAMMMTNGATVATDGFIGAAFPEELAVEIEKRFIETGEPKDLTLVYGAGQGDAKSRGLNHFGHEGLLRRVIGGHWGLVPKVQRLAVENKIEAYNFPQGVLSHMFRDIAAHKPGTITHIGLATFVDPRLEGGSLNARTQTQMVRVIKIDGEEYLRYPSFPIDFALIRGTTADPEGNVTMEKEALTAEMLSVAQAARNSGGKVIVQVERMVETGALNPKEVVVPGIFVDCIVIASKPEYHMQTFGTEYEPAFCGHNGDMTLPDMADSAERRIICRRAAMEMRAGAVVNLGIGMPEGIAQVVQNSTAAMDFTVTVESGPIGGMPASGLDFGCSRNPQAIIDQPYQFDFYQGGGLDIAFLGMAQADRAGNVNVSKFGNRIAGCGGFIDITQTAKKVVFCGTFIANGLKVACGSGRLEILNEGSVIKMMKHVEQITFSGDYAIQKAQEVLYVTERAVFRLTNEGVVLIEVAPGISVKDDIIERMEFTPCVSKTLKIMDSSIFN